MTDLLTIPVGNNPKEFFSVQLDGYLVLLKTRWNFTDESWYMSIEIPDTGTKVDGIKMVGGVELLEPYAIREIGLMFLVDNEDENSDPDFDNFGTRYQLRYLPIGGTV